MATQAYIEQQYRELLGRAPDAGGLTHYLRYSNPVAVRNEILGSSEYRNRVAQQQAPRPAAPAPAPAPSAADKLFTDLTNFDKTAQNPLDVYNKTLDSLGIADARTRVSSTKQQLINTENLLRNVEGSVSGRTQNSLVTEAQRQRLVSMEQAPLNEGMRIQNQNFDLAAGDYDRILGEGNKKTELFVQGQTQKRQAIIDRLQIAKDNAKTAEDKRRWEVQIDLQKQKMAQEQSQWQADYELKKAEASRPRSSGGGGSGGSSSSGGGLTAAQREHTVYAAIGRNLAAVRGSDGYVSPDSYAKAKADFVKAGYSSAEFDNQWSNLRNPKNPYYKLG